MRVPYGTGTNRGHNGRWPKHGYTREYTSAGGTCGTPDATFDLPRHRTLDMRGTDTHTNTVSRSNPESGMAKCTAAASRRAGTDTDTSYISTQKRRSTDFPPKMIDPHAVRTHPPPARRCEPEGVGSEIPDNERSYPYPEPSRRRESARETRKERPRGEGGEARAKQSRSKISRLGEVDGRGGLAEKRANPG
ncbi:hypothetical protein B0H14DRAFT_2841304 [Mycena olivaceomarginata]|nr:hypothetical protein B0H14DRAFT_2841304 [Mycena olivaceomarginata]